MATIKKAALKIPVTEDQIITLYMDDVLQNNKTPDNVYIFCKRNALEEADFYTFFNSLSAIRQEIWTKFFDNAQTAMDNEPGFVSYSEKDKLLTLYFTLFEIFKLNRTYVMISLQDNGKGIANLKDLAQFRTHFRDFVAGIFTESRTKVSEKITRVAKPVVSEGAWLQFLFLLKYWLDDTSRGFEKTDILIEKSVTTVLGLLDSKPLENLIDLGKFLWKN